MDKYDIGDVLGKGSYGCARLAKRRSDGKQVVVKVLPTLQAKDVKVALKEINILGGLGHPNIIEYLSSFEAQSCIQIVTEYANSGDLSTLISKRRKHKTPPDTPLTYNIMIQTLMALRYLHGNRVLHRDLKPANIFLTTHTSGSLIVKIGDFGVSTVLKSNSNLANTFCGTLHYLAPEVCEDKPYNNKADVWAAGCCTYEMISGKRAFDAKAVLALGNKIINGVPDPLPKGVDEGLRQLVGMMLIKSPALRPNASKLLVSQLVREGVKNVAGELLDQEEYTAMYGQEIAKAKGLKRRGNGDDFQKDLKEMEAWAARDIVKLQQQEHEDAISILGLGSQSPSPVPSPSMRSTRSTPPPSLNSSLKKTSSPRPTQSSHAELTRDVTALLASREEELLKRLSTPSLDEPRDEDFTDTVCLHSRMLGSPV